MSSGPDPAAPTLPVSVALPGGGSLIVRRVQADDVDRLVTLYSGLSDTDRRRRFFTQYRATRAWVVDWIRRCREGGASIVAEVAGSGELVAEAAYVLQPNGNGDFSLTVDSGWRGWLGPYLLDVLVELAAANGVANLEAEILTENRSMQAIVRRRGAFLSGDSDHTVVHVVIGTQGRMPRWAPGDDRPRVLVEIPGGRWGRAAELDRAGYEVLGCPGPGRRHQPCPALAGEACPLAAMADAIVVAMPPGDAEELAVAHGRQHPDVPLVVVGGVGGPDTPDVDRPELAPTCRLGSGATSTELLEALDRLLPGGRSEDLRHSTPRAEPARDEPDVPTRRPNQASEPPASEPPASESEE